MPLCLTSHNYANQQLTVLVLLSISGRLVQLTDDEGRSAGDNLHLAGESETERQTVA